MRRCLTLEVSMSQEGVVDVVAGSAPVGSLVDVWANRAKTRFDEGLTDWGGASRVVTMDAWGGEKVLVAANAAAAIARVCGTFAREVEGEDSGVTVSLTINDTYLDACYVGPEGEPAEACLISAGRLTEDILGLAFGAERGVPWDGIHEPSYADAPAKEDVEHNVLPPLEGSPLSVLNKWGLFCPLGRPEPAATASTLAERMSSFGRPRLNSGFNKVLLIGVDFPLIDRLRAKGYAVMESDRYDPVVVRDFAGALLNMVFIGWGAGNGDFEARRVQNDWPDAGVFFRSEGLPDIKGEFGVLKAGAQQCGAGGCFLLVNDCGRRDWWIDKNTTYTIELPEDGTFNGGATGDATHTVVIKDEGLKPYVEALGLPLGPNRDAELFDAFLVAAEYRDTSCRFKGGGNKEYRDMACDMPVPELALKLLSEVGTARAMNDQEALRLVRSRGLAYNDMIAFLKPGGHSAWYMKRNCTILLELLRTDKPRDQVEDFTNVEDARAVQCWYDAIGASDPPDGAWGGRGRGHYLLCFPALASRVCVRMLAVLIYARCFVGRRKMDPPEMLHYLTLMGKAPGEKLAVRAMSALIREEMYKTFEGRTPDAVDLMFPAGEGPAMVEIGRSRRTGSAAVPSAQQ